MGRIRELWEEDVVAYGMHSNIPLCCCLYFVDVWWPALTGRPLQGDILEHRQAVDRAVRNTGGALQYVPCPDCIKGKIFRPLHICNNLCAMRGRTFQRQLAGRDG